jgi:hypothetical protein
MVDESEGMSGYSLADLAEIDVSDIEEVRFSTLPAGGYEFEVTDADLGEDEKDGERRFFARFDMKVVGVKVVLEQGVDKESLVGKSHSERFFVTPSAPEEDVKTSIGRIRAFITDIGQDSSGALGKIVREAKGHVFPGKIVKQKDKHDKSIEYARLKLDPKK